MDAKKNIDSYQEDITIDYETKEFVQNKNKNSIYIKNKIKNQTIIKIRILFIFPFIIFLLLFLLINIIINKNTQNYISKILKGKRDLNKNISIFNSIYSPKWIVITTINPPNQYTDVLLSNAPDPWKIVVIGDIKTNNASWEIFKNSSKLVYLSIEDQLKLNYNINKYIPLNSYSRKNIGYLFAIQHGAKEIYETDDNIYMFGESLLNRYIDKYVYYAENNNSLMINPYNFYGKPTIWPRGFKIKDIEKDVNTKFYRVVSRRTELNLLIFQGLLNINPDVDSIFSYTRLKKDNSMNEIFYSFGCLMYLPGNFVPINSKNTRYLYDIFPCLALPITVSKRVSDIWRGYIMQRYAWIYNGTVLYNSPCANNQREYHNDSLDLIKEKDLFFKLEDLLNSLNIDVNEKINHPNEFLIYLIELLIDKGL